MKKVMHFLFAAIILVAFSCQDESNYIYNTTESTDQKFQNGPSNNQQDGLVILYPDGTTEAEKILKRAEYGVTEYEQCPCGDENLELWVFDGYDGISVEEKTETAKSDEEIEEVESDPIITVDPHQFISGPMISAIENAFPQVVPANTGITVAVLDTGIDFTHDGFPSSFLYNGQNDPCSDNGYTDIFGWNFVANNNNPFDDYPGRHGTIITDIITANLTENNIPHQILPVKIANAYGNIRYFDALCGFQYAVKKENVKVINMSFGWYQNELSLLGRFIEEVSEKILVVSSAGNSESNNDQIPHFPSSYELENILAVTSIEGARADETSTPDPGLAYFANHGIQSVDIAAVGEDIPFIYGGETYYVSGTSFSAAFGSFFSALNYQNGMSTSELKTQVIANSIFSQNLSEIKYSKYIPTQ